jgi:TrmH RNA methyltransferase
VPAEEWLARHASEPGPRTIVALEQVGNPHNLGALLRTCAHFGVRTVVVDDAESLLSGAAMRTAEGGAEFVEIVAAERIDRFVAEARRRGWRIAATSSREGADLFRTELPARCIVLFGEEAHGLSKKLLSEADVRLRVPGTSQVESLNVSAAAAVILGEFWRRRPG